MRVHNQKYVKLAEGHFRTFKVEYDSQSVPGRTKSFLTEEEANDFIDNLPYDAFYRLSQHDQLVLRQSGLNLSGKVTLES